MDCKPAPDKVNKSITLSLIQTKIFTALILRIFFSYINIDFQEHSSPYLGS